MGAYEVCHWFYFLAYSDSSGFAGTYLDSPAGIAHNRDHEPGHNGIKVFKMQLDIRGYGQPPDICEEVPWTGQKRRILMEIRMRIRY